MPEPPAPAPEAFNLEPSKHPVKVELELSATIVEQLDLRSRATGRSIDELILELLDQGLHGD